MKLIIKAFATLLLISSSLVIESVPMLATHEDSGSADTVAQRTSVSSSTSLYIRDFDGRTFGPVSVRQTVPGGDVYRGWSWDGITASYLAVDSTGKTILYVRPFDGDTFGSVSVRQTVPGGDVYRDLSWDGTTVSYVVAE